METLRTWESKMSSFTGMIRLTVIEATGLKPVNLPGGKVLTVMEPYCVIDFDDFFFGATTPKSMYGSLTFGGHFLVLREVVKEG